MSSLDELAALPPMEENDDSSERLRASLFDLPFAWRMLAFGFLLFLSDTRDDVCEPLLGSSDSSKLSLREEESVLVAS